MMSYPLPTLAPTVSAAGISTVSFYDIQQSLIASAKQIFGNDVYLGNDSQDGQLIGVFSQAINDCNQIAAAVFNSFSPTYSQGAQLSSLVGINGLQRIRTNISCNYMHRKQPPSFAEINAPHFCEQSESRCAMVNVVLFPRNALF